MGFFSKAIGGLFGGGSKDVKREANKGYNYLVNNENMKEAQSTGLQAQTMLAALLGLNPDDQGAADRAFGQYRDSTGYNFMMDQGMDAITGSRAARGTLNSGAASKELMKFGQGMAAQSFQDFLSQIGSLGSAGMDSAYKIGGVAAEAGGRSAAAERQSQEDAAGTLGGIFGGLFG